MADSTVQLLQNHRTNHESTTTTTEVSRQEIRAAIAKAVELRALHVAVMQGSSPVNLRYPPSASPLPRHASQFSAQNYPIFTPSYEDEPLPGYQQLHLDTQTLSECWEEYGLVTGNCDQTILSDYKTANEFSSELIISEPHICPAEDQNSVTDRFRAMLRTSPGTDSYRSSQRNSYGDLKSVSSCNKCKPAIISTETSDNNATKNSKNSNTTVVPLTDSQSSSLQPPPKNRPGLNLSWMFPRRLKKKHKNESSPNRTELEEVFSQVSGVMSVETLKKELVEVAESRDAALMEVGEMKLSLGELKQKLEYLETYCEEMKKALRQQSVMQQSKDSQVPEKLENLPKKGKSINEGGEILMPVSEEVMVEGFLQVVSEARLSVRQFCKSLISQIEETDATLVENLNLLLQPFKLSLNSKYSKAVLYHFEAIINQCLYQDFENSVFQKNGSPKLLDPHEDRQSQFSSFVSLRNLSWNEVLRKGTKFYSEEFSKFCDQKMSCIVTTLNWTRPWSEQLLQSFFVAAKCIWLLHLLAFSFNPPLGILRVEENRSFDPHFMEDIFVDRERSHGASRVKIMVMPGFYVQDRVLRCKVLCRYRSVA